MSLFWAYFEEDYCTGRPLVHFQLSDAHAYRLSWMIVCDIATIVTGIFICCLMFHNNCFAFDETNKHVCHWENIQSPAYSHSSILKTKHVGLWALICLKGSICIAFSSCSIGNMSVESCLLIWDCYVADPTISVYSVHSLNSRDYNLYLDRKCLHCKHCNSDFRLLYIFQQLSLLC